MYDEFDISFYLLLNNYEMKCQVERFFLRHERKIVSKPNTTCFFWPMFSYVSRYNF